MTRLSSSRPSAGPFLTTVLALAILTSLRVEGQDCFAAKVVGITDGDSLTLLRGSSQLRVRLEGIDAPERGQAYGQVARDKLSNLVFDRVVRSCIVGTDSYKRALVRLNVDGRDIAEALVEAGLAWHYKYYNHEPKLAHLEEAAREAERGLWAQHEPMPPWDYRRGSGRHFQASEQETHDDGTPVYRGNVKSRIFHAPWCEYYRCKNCTAIFYSREAAIAAGYRPGRRCNL